MTSHTSICENFFSFFFLFFLYLALHWVYSWYLISTCTIESNIFKMFKTIENDTLNINVSPCRVNIFQYPVVFAPELLHYSWKNKDNIQLNHFLICNGIVIFFNLKGSHNHGCYVYSHTCVIFKLDIMYLLHLHNVLHIYICILFFIPHCFWFRHIHIM